MVYRLLHFRLPQSTVHNSSDVVDSSRAAQRSLVCDLALSLCLCRLFGGGGGTDGQGMMMFSVIVLIGTGWSYLKPFLTERDKQMMLIILVVQFMFNIAALVLEETSPGAAGWLTWRDILHLLDMICCCIILLPIMWSIRHLREAAEVDGKAARNMVRLKRFRTFYLLVVSYVYFTRIVVFLLNATLPFELTWLGTVISELGTLAFYAVTGWLFRPQAQNPYLALDTDESATGSEAVIPSAEVEL